jgi:hypothetical protein
MLKGQPLDLAPLRMAWSGLPDERFDDYLSALPVEWAAANDAMEAALTDIPRMNPELEAHCSDFLRFPEVPPGLWPVACDPALEWCSPVGSEHFAFACGRSPPVGLLVNG